MKNAYFDLTMVEIPSYQSRFKIVKTLMAAPCILFEPWSLGDALIAASTLLVRPENTWLACDLRWHRLLSQIVNKDQLLAVELSYTARGRAHPFDLKSAVQNDRAAGSLADERVTVLSIRGDLRDYFSARSVFPGSRIRMTGWTSFIARRSQLINAYYSIGIGKVANRYETWATLRNIPFEEVEVAYRERQLIRPGSKEINIHVGAQWRSKQYPRVAELRERLARKGYQVTLLAGLADPLPPDITENEVRRLIDDALIEKLKTSAVVVTNDSGPMHLAAVLGCRTVALARTSNINEWIPPLANAVISDSMPKGYRPDPRYNTDQVLDGWPDLAQISDEILRMANG